MGRLLGLDYGTKRVGVAISDTSRLIASPFAVIDAATTLTALDEIQGDIYCDGDTIRALLAYGARVDVRFGN